MVSVIQYSTVVLKLYLTSYHLIVFLLDTIVRSSFDAQGHQSVILYTPIAPFIREFGVEKIALTKYFVVHVVTRGKY